MNILFLSLWFPYPPNNGSRIRVYNLIKQLSKNHNITLLSFIQDDFKEENIEPLKIYCKEIVTIKSHWFNPTSFKSIIGFFHKAPRSLVDMYSKEMQIKVNEKIKNEKYDLIFCSQIFTSMYSLHLNKITKIFDEIEIGIVKDRQNIRYKLTWWKMRYYLKNILPKYDGYTVVSDKEKNNIINIDSYALGTIIPNGIDTTEINFSFNSNAKDLIYTGSLTYEANYDAIKYFLEEIYPLIKKEIPNISLKITGSTKGININGLKLDETVKLTGYLDDIKPLITNSSVCIVPLRIGGGTRVKILEAAALGTPIVSTKKGAEGLKGLQPLYNISHFQSNLSKGLFEQNEPNHPFNICIADNPLMFTKAVVALSMDREMARQIAKNARKLVEQRYNWNKIGEQYETFIKEVFNKK